jgi:hypothetical protein
MWLFDNLFLDANTPITINDGVDHSKDVVQAIVDPSYWTWSAWSTGWAQGDDASWSWKKDDSKKDDSFVTLFDADKKEEIEALATLGPKTQEKDIALEIWHAPDLPIKTELSTESAVDFDIGGDISFDIGGDMNPMPNQSMTTEMPLNPPISTDSSVSFLSDSVLPVVDISTSEANSSVLTTTDSDSTHTAEKTEGISESIPLASSNTDNALFSLLNESSPPSDIKDVSVNPTSSTLEGGQSENANNISILDLTSEPPTFLASEIIKPTGEAVLSEDGSWSIVHSALAEIALWSQVSTESLAISSMIQPSSSSNKLKAKLSQFLGELESMEVGDSTQKEHKMQQIDMCRIRISEIRNEYDMRIAALQKEMHALEKEVRDMDTEKTHIKAVIETFQKELEVA